MNKKQKKVFTRIIVAAVLMVVLSLLPIDGWLKFVLFMIPYLVIGHDILLKAWKGILNRQVFDENFLMAVATIGAILLGDYKEGVAVMLFYQIGELFQSPVKDNVLHIDFYHVVPGKPISIDVPVRLTGNSEGVKQGGKLILSKRKVRISATMENLPDEIVVDVTTLGLGKSIFVGDLQYDNITLLTPASTAVCAVKMTRAARGAAAAAAE